MALAPELVGTIQAIPGLISLAFLKPALDNRDKPGAESFIVFVLAVAVWSLALGAGNFLGGYTGSLLAYRVVLLAVEVAAVAWFLVAAEVTDLFRPTRRLVWGLAAVVVALQALLWTNPVHHLFLGPETAMAGRVLVPAYRVGFWVHSGVAYLLIALTVGLLIVETVQSQGLKRRQTALLLLATLPPIAMSVVSVADLLFPPYDFTPLGYLVTEGLIAVALFSGRFLDIVPVARRTALGEMNDAVVTLDGQNRVIDCNDAARDTFGVGEEYMGLPAVEFFAPAPADVLAQFEDVTEVDTEIAVTIDGKQRHFSLSISPVSGYTGDERVVVLREITLLKEREQQLDLMRQVQSRVLRHNIRNDLQVVRGYTERLAEEVTGKHGRIARRAHEKTDDIASISEKARAVERLIDQDQSPEEFDLCAMLEEIVTEAREQFPAVTFELDCSNGRSVETAPALRLALENLVENGAEHTDTSDPRVTISVSDDPDGTVVTIADDGPGIPDHELVVLNKDEETPLEHGSGLGLWVVRWVVDRTRVSLDYETRASGTTMKLHVPD